MKLSAKSARCIEKEYVRTVSQELTSRVKRRKSAKTLGESEGGHMKESVKSSNVEAMDYDEKTEVMTIFYKGGSTYEYSAVKKQYAEQLKKAPSFGKLLHQYRRQWNWEYKRV